MPVLRDTDLDLPLASVRLPDGLSSTVTPDLSHASVSTVASSSISPIPPIPADNPSSTGHEHPSATTEHEPYHELMHRKYKRPGWTPLGPAPTAR